jgi:hypothetical protein
MWTINHGNNGRRLFTVDFLFVDPFGFPLIFFLLCIGGGMGGVENGGRRTYMLR